MDSLNVPVPPAVERLAADLAPELSGMILRDDLSLLLKRFPDSAPDVEKRVRRALRGAPAFEVRADEIGVFYDPPAGPAPVVYVAVDGPGLRRVHRRLCEVVDPVPGMEGEEYSPHVTLARGEDRSLGLETPHDVARRLDGREVGPVTWTVEHLEFRNKRYPDPAGRVSLPG